MSRFLFVVPPLAGHVNPTVAVAGELVRRGHAVAWAGDDVVLSTLVPTGARLFGATAEEFDGTLLQARDRWLGLRGPAALKFFWQEFVVPLGYAMLPGVDAAVREFRPDVIVGDQQAIAGAAAALRHGIPWVTSATTSAELTRPLAAIPKVEEWVQDCLARFQRDAGLFDPVDLRFSPRLVICFTTQELVGRDAFPGHFLFTGPALTPRPSTPFPWDRLDPDARRVLVSLGTLNGGSDPRFFRVALAALADVAQLVLIAPDGLVENPPASAIVQERVPQLELLPHMDAVVSHGGHNTVCETLAFGLPLVVAPIRDDQPIVAQQVADAGAGIRVRFGRLRPDELRDAVSRVLDDPAYRRAAERVRLSFTAAGGAGAAAARLERAA